MTIITVLPDSPAGREPRSVTATLELGHALIAPADLETATGWKLQPEGLCRADVCVPVRDPSDLEVAGRVDLVAVAGVLDQPILVADDDALVVIGERRADRHLALDGHTAPSFTLPDLDGVDHSLHEWDGRKRLLFAFFELVRLLLRPARVAGAAGRAGLDRVHGHRRRSRRGHRQDP